MIKRVIFGLIWTVFGITLLCLRDTFLLSVVLAAFCVIATYELNKAIKLENKPIAVLSLIASACVPFYYEFGEYLGALPINLNSRYIVCIYILTLCICMLFEYEKTKFSHVASVVLSSLCVPFAITTFLYFRDIDEYFPEQNYDTNHGLFLILFTLFCACITDAGAYFTGTFLGKHKLCPKISPKKTIEGAVGGLLISVVSSVILYAVFSNFVFETSNNRYLTVILLSLFLSVVGMCGDLTASVIKRNFGIKDFGNLIPGHGGILDRFDSIIFVLAALYAVLNIFGVVI